MDQLIHSLMDLADRLLDGRATWSEFQNAVLGQAAISGTVQHMPHRDPDRRSESALKVLAEVAVTAFFCEGGTQNQFIGLNQVLFQVGENVASGRFGAPFFDGIGTSRS